MMKYTFNTGDKVFAKIKGYPPWPAKIVATNGRRYDVEFYGTGETGTVKDDCLFYYIKHKKRFMKSLKRKDYIDAIEEIESEIKTAGTDGNEVGENVLTVLEKKEEIKVNTKRKRISEEKHSKKIFLLEDTNSPGLEKSFDDDDLSKTEKNLELSKSQVSRSGRKIKVKRFSDEEDDEMEKKVLKRSKSQVIGDQKFNIDALTTNKQSEVNEGDITEKSIHNTQDAAEVSDSDSIVQSKEWNLSDITIITKEYLQAQIEYALEVKKNESTYKKRLQDYREVKENNMVIAKLPSGKLIGVRYIQMEECSSEYDYVMQEEYYAQNVLNKVNQLENGAIDVDDNSNMFETNLKFDETDLDENIKQKILEWKEEKINWLKVECNMVNFDAKIRSNLGLDKADPKEALEYLNNLQELNIESLMLKKHPHIVDVIKRLRKYIGNVKEWNLTKEELETFQNDAKNIRITAESIYHKFKKLFNIEPDQSFWEEFNEISKEFKNKTKNLSENEIFMLWHEPDSWKTFLDRVYEKHEESIPEKSDIDETKMDKENLSKVANSENKLEENK